MLIAPECDLGVNSIKEISKYFRTFGRLKTLNLDRNPLGEEGTIKLSELIPFLPIEDLSVMSANMSSRSGGQILKSFIGHSTLKHVNLSSPDGFNRNKIGNESLSILTTILSHERCSI